MYVILSVFIEKQFFSVAYLKYNEDGTKLLKGCHSLNYSFSVSLAFINSVGSLVKHGCNITQSFYKNSNFSGFELGWFAVYLVAVQLLENPVAAF